MKKINLKKQGMEMNMATLFTFIVLAVSFGIILLFWVNLNPQGNIDKEACHTSVVLRATASSSLLKMEFRDTIPLQCKTENICFTSGFLSPGCEQVLGKTYTSFNVGSNKNKILDALAENIYSWHTTLGEGKINFMPRGFSGSNFCFLDSLISFDNKTQEQLKKDNVQITLFDLYNYLGQKKTEEGSSYFQELFKSQFETQTAYNTLKDSNLAIDFSKQYALVTTISEVGTWKSWGVALVGGSTASVVTNVVLFAAFAPAGAVGLSIKGIIFVAKVGLAAGGAAGYAMSNDPDSKKTYVYSPPALYLYEPEALKKLDCSSWENLPS